jgi:hypothetical protein
MFDRKEKTEQPYIDDPFYLFSKLKNYLILRILYSGKKSAPADDDDDDDYEKMDEKEVDRRHNPKFKEEDKPHPFSSFDPDLLFLF